MTDDMTNKTIEITSERAAWLSSMGLGVECNDGTEFAAAGYVVKDGKVDRYGWTEVKPGSGKIAERIVVACDRNGLWYTIRFVSGSGRVKPYSVGDAGRKAAFAAIRDMVKGYRSASWTRDGYRVIPGPRAQETV